MVLRRRSQPTLRLIESVLLGDGVPSGELELVDVVGESFYQDAISSVCGRRGDEAISTDCVAVLAAQPDNPHDPNAIAVQIDDQIVGHLSREDAILYHPIVDTAAQLGTTLTCDAHIAARGPGKATTNNAGVFLHLPSPEDAARMLAEWSRERRG